ncbi:DUF2851 family protein [Fontisphaera persica]|uniref:DUF2851 family protein n=1 Tax=Fontisphaera persica TaxID=2974023 RepID=UPI0024C096EC|nr:DUF2851 family protein [Fontisphaera persica]WCJ59863.1 DUF2851 family protein [Fontisphaera persica]
MNDPRDMAEPPASLFYAQWRESLAPPALRETATAAPPERWLQWIWQHQRLQRERLRLLDGRKLRVLHPGFCNREPGPDFRQAVLQLDNDLPRQGDVEIDVQAAGWRQHGHDRNPAYAQVVLHVLWENPAQASPALPALALKDYLEAPLEVLAAWIGADAAPELPPEQAGRCAAAWRELSATQRDELLHQAALVRLHGKALQLLHRARVAGWEQALWEGVFRALGYKHNTWPMQNLGEMRERLQAGSSNALHCQARLLGVSGLLPADMDGRAGNAAHARQLWDWWWRERDAFADCLMPRTLWRLGGLRPANHPQRRLALAGQWLAAPRWTEQVKQWFDTDWPASALTSSLIQGVAAQDDFWDWHWSLHSPRLPRRQPMLGEERATDLAVNALLPWFYAQALECRDRSRLRRVEQRFLSWPAGQDNAVLKLARQRLLGGSRATCLKTAAAQQGLLQIVRDCCDQANALCEPCLFPDLVRQFGSRHPDSSAPRNI